MTKQRIAIIGAGIGGTSILRRLTTHGKFNTNIKIDIYDKKRLLGRGFAFKHDSKYLLTNSTTEEMSMKKDKKDYIKWLEANNIDIKLNMSRDLFGDYVQDIYKNILKNHKNVNEIGEIIIDIIYNPSNHEYTLVSESQKNNYDAVFFVPGTLEYKDPYHLNGIKNYIQNPYPVPEKLKNISGDIGIIGSRLSAIDVIRYLLLEEKKERLFIFSRKGKLPAVRGPVIDIKPKYFTKENIDKNIKDDHIRLGIVVRLFNKEMRHQKINTHLFNRLLHHPKDNLLFDLKYIEEVAKIEFLILAVENLFTYVYMYLNREDKARYLRLYHPFIQEYHSPMPYSVAKQIISWINEGRLLFVDNMETVEIEDRFIVKTTDKEVPVDYLINATGPTTDIKKDRRFIFKNMLNRTLLGSSEFGGALVTRNFEIISPRYGTLSNFYAIGEIARGKMYRGDSVSILVDKSKDIVEHYYKS